MQPDGSKIAVETVISVIKDEKGNKAGLLSITRDITSRVEIDQWLFESNQRLRYVVEAAEMMVYEINLEDRQIIIIRGLEELLGYGAGEVPSTVEWWISQIHPDDRFRAQEQFCPTKPVEKIVNTYRIRSKDGNYIFVHGIAKVLKDRLGNLERIIGSMQNITEKKRLESQLKENERLRAVGETAGMVGHDLRNPLQAMVSELYLAESELHSMPESEKKTNMLEAIHSISEQVSYMDKIVSDLQSFTKPVEVHKQKVDLKDLITGLLAQISIPSNIQTSMCFDETITLEADPQLLKRVLINLVTNSVQAMPQGGELSIQACSDDEGHIDIIVEDTGIGISEQVKPKLFTPLFTTKSRGQGFGLAVCKRVIEAQGGTISFESQEGKGTKFIVRLPAS